MSDKDLIDDFFEQKAKGQHDALGQAAEDWLANFKATIHREHVKMERRKQLRAFREKVLRFLRMKKRTNEG